MMLQVPPKALAAVLLLALLLLPGCAQCMQCRSASDCRNGSRCVSGWCLNPPAPAPNPTAPAPAAASRATPAAPAPTSGGSTLNDCSKRGTCGGASCRARTDCENGLRCVSGTCTKNRHRRLQATA